MRGTVAYILSGSGGGSSGTTTTDASLLTSGTLNDARLSANITKQGNVFNGANQLVKADSTGKIPVANMPIGLVNIVSVANETARLALATSNVLTVAFQADTMKKYSLNASLNPSISSNWVDDGSYATTVPPTRKVNNKTLENDITLGLSDIVTLNNAATNYIGGDGNLHSLPTGVAISDWILWTPVITADTNPIFTNSVFKCAYKTNGKSAILSFSLMGSNTGNYGSGIYKIIMPGGLKIDTRYVALCTSSSWWYSTPLARTYLSMGNGYYYDATVYALSETELIIRMSVGDWWRSNIHGVAATVGFITQEIPIL